MFPAVLSAAMKLEEGGRPTDKVTHHTLAADLEAGRISWSKDTREELEFTHYVASIQLTDGSGVLEIRIPSEPFSDPEKFFPVGVQFVDEDLAADIRLREITRRMLADAVPEELK